jgi:hypothetical protein
LKNLKTNLTPLSAIKLNPKWDYNVYFSVYVYK